MKNFIFTVWVVYGIETTDIVVPAMTRASAIEAFTEMGYHMDNVVSIAVEQ